MAESAMAGETDLVLLRPPPPKSLSLNDRDRLMILGLMGVEVKSLELPKSPWPAAASQGRSMTLQFKFFFHMWCPNNNRSGGGNCYFQTIQKHVQDSKRFPLQICQEIK